VSALTKWNPFGTGEEMDLLRPVSRWDPFREMEEEMTRLWDRMDRMTGRWPKGTKAEGLTAMGWSPSVDIAEDEKEYLVKAELPEVKKDEIKVQVHDHTLSISGERKSEKEEKGKKYHRIERAYGSFERSFLLPENADVGKITSEFKDGMLNVHLPKVPGSTPKPIEVKVA
jgi:HSP20 family protein